MIVSSGLTAPPFLGFWLLLKFTGNSRPLLPAARRLGLARRRALDASLEGFHEIDDVTTRGSLDLARDDRVTLHFFLHELLERRAVVILELLWIERATLLFNELHRKVDHLF